MAITYMTREGYKKKMDEIAYLENTMPLKKLKECWK